MRTSDICARLAEDGGKDRLREKTGLPLAPYFSGSKLAWLLENVEGLRADAEAGEALFGTMDTYLIWKLSGGARHVTDPSNACRTLLMDIQKVGSFDVAMC
jgi:glycerol kinase